MNKEQLETIKERVANATPGEWSTELCYDRLIGTYLLLTDKGELVLSTYDNPTKQDAKFIAHARQDISALIAEVERLQKALKNTDADLYVYKDLYNEMTDKNIELIKFLQARITKGWGQKAVDLAMIHIQEQEKDIERLRTQVGTEFFKYGELTTAYEEVTGHIEELCAEFKRLRTGSEATEDLFRRMNEELAHEREENKLLHDESKRLRDRNKRLREALEFYADEENYEWHEINDLETVPGDVLNDNGDIARQVLGGDKCS